MVTETEQGKEWLNDHGYPFSVPVVQQNTPRTLIKRLDHLKGCTLDETLQCKWAGIFAYLTFYKHKYYIYHIHYSQSPRGF